MLFKKRFEAGIRDGTITMTFRAWQNCRVTAGRQYRCGSIGFIEVDSVDSIALAEITVAEARACSFDSPAELVEMLRKSSARKLTRKSKVFRVRFHYVGPAKPKPQPRMTAANLQALTLRLQRMDRLSKRRPWTRNVLRLISTQPGVAASRLAAQIGRETQAFKADARKLKGLGLTRSLKVGYELSTAGKALLRRLP